MEIGLFQLENLFMVPSRFKLLDVRETREPLGPELDKYLQKASACPAHEAKTHLEKAGADKNSPVVILCERGERSGEVARDLEAAGFTQVYIIAGGAAGLLSEL